ncbi:unnamed protein product [Acanthosepion pharaonis]|uniref:Uncharacterized protein n=1 Tax=Acanthosepion pharaonis TaxID=158019 RepID=A0A812DY21_ACAPH|nr:unnamed protein product [Sepia pharaonis]
MSHFHFLSLRASPLYLLSRLSLFFLPSLTDSLRQVERKRLLISKNISFLFLTLRISPLDLYLQNSSSFFLSFFLLLLSLRFISAFDIQDSSSFFLILSKECFLPIFYLWDSSSFSFSLLVSSLSFIYKTFLFLIFSFSESFPYIFTFKNLPLSLCLLSIIYLQDTSSFFPLLFLVVFPLYLFIYATLFLSPTLRALSLYLSSTRLFLFHIS